MLQESGDSGSYIIEESTGDIVAQLFADKGGYAIGYPIRHALDFLRNKEMHLQLGQRARFIHGCNPLDIQCDEGEIIEVKTKYPNTPLAEIWYTLMFDKPLFKQSFFGKVHEISASAVEFEAIT